MGTRNLTMVIEGEQTRVVQYGQWDGYPEGAGTTVLTFLSKNDLNLFRKKLAECRFLGADEIDNLNNKGHDSWSKSHPQLSRDHGAKVLQMIYDNQAREFVNQTSFAADSLFCEWAYVIDLDKGVLEVYKGFNKQPLTENDRFFNLQKLGEEYMPIKMLKSYPLDNLPTEEEFIKELTESDDEEGEEE